MTIAQRLTKAATAVCPAVVGVSIGRRNDRSTYRVDYDGTETPEQVAAVAVIVASFDPDAPTPEMVNAERDRRMRTITHNGRLYNFDAESQINIAASCTLAASAVAAGSQPGDLRWMSPTYDFFWIAADNSLVSMDAHQMLAFGAAAAQYKSGLIFKARALKDANPIPTDYTHDRHWS
jgi:hypothetical protein